MTSNITSVSKKVGENEKYEADLEQALSVVGIGVYNFKYCLVLSLFLIASIVEPVGYSYVLPSARCDLQMTDSQRGFIASVPYIGVVLTSFPWGYLVDTRGRKPILIISSLAAGTLGILSGFMPELISFTACKFLASLCIACPAAVPYSYISEILPQHYRDLALSVTNSMQILGSALVPLLAWAILPQDFRVDFGLYEFRAWRLLCIVYALFFIMAAGLIAFGPESPKYLVSQGKREEALKVLRTMYASNKGKSPDTFPIKALKVSDDPERNKIGFFTSLRLQTAPLMKPPLVKWMLLNGFLLFGVFNVLNGLWMWVPDVLNRVLTGGGDGSLTACGVIALGQNVTVDEGECIDTIDELTYMINSLASIVCALIALAASTTVKCIGKKMLVIIVFLLIGLFCMLINVTTQQLLFAVLLTSLPLTGLAIGPVNAYSVELFPTHLRGMAVSLSMMFGRFGSIFGANVAGLMINSTCEGMFYMFGGLLLFCGLLTFLLPRSSPLPNKKEEMMTRL
ncbi:hypothetical protein evm_006643 [Chilo suppressalis]|nr:hypothetical protein evm_006643 [Chilo suppressalis]